MKNLKSTILIFLMSLSIFGFSQTTDTVYATKSELYNVKIDTDVSINVFIGDTVVVIDDDKTFVNSNVFLNKKDTLAFDSTFVPSTKWNIFAKYTVISKDTINLLITEYGDTNGLNITLIDKDSVTGINNINVNKINISVFPNPSKSNFTVKSTSKIEKIEILTEVGQSVKTIDLKSMGYTLETEFNVITNDLASGLYFVRINDSNIERLVINR
jgi:hypothetical protein